MDLSILVLLAVLTVVSHADTNPFMEDISGKFDFSAKFNSHPMLYFTADEIPNLRRKAETTHKHIMADIIEAKNIMLADPEYFIPPKNYQKFAAEWNEIYGNNLPLLALYSLLYPEETKVFDFVIQYMDNMVHVGKWQVIGMEEDEVPINHQLAGFATAFDFLYNRFDERRKAKYAKKLVDVTHEIYVLSYKRWWGTRYIQNHVSTNTVGLLMGAIVSRPFHDNAWKWMQRAVRHYERTMWLLDRVGDGTTNEGVSYGGYTSRSLTQYVYLVKRHFNRDHSKNRWLKEHFWFFYGTVLPGFKWTVGIGDSANSWFYGPESQLVFLDNYVMKNGSGNWLAEQIRDHRGNNNPSYGQRWTTLHTEFIWYNAALTPRAPRDHGRQNIHVFPDWGVATYGYATGKSKNKTFLSFKASATHGKAIFQLAKRAKFLDGWYNFNIGHEHPDKNSFVFAPNGEQFISEGLYGPKFTFLDNTLMFGPSNAGYCRNSWVGQLGDCARWLQIWRNPEESNSWAKIVNAEIKNGIVHISGEAAKAYPPSVGLVSYYRNLLLLNPQLLLVYDYIEKKETARINKVSAFFNNWQHIFKPYEQGGGFVLNLADGKYRAVYTTYGGQRPRAHARTETRGRQSVYNVNVTFNLEGPKTDLAYVFYGPDMKIRDFQFLQRVSGEARIRIKANSLVYEVKLLCDYESGSESMKDKKFEVKISPGG